jgi:hypothetical protein
MEMKGSRVDKRQMKTMHNWNYCWTLTMKIFMRSSQIICIHLVLGWHYLKNLLCQYKNDDMDAEMIAAMQNPSHTPPDFDEISKLSIDIFLSMYNASQAMYGRVKDVLAQCHNCTIHSQHIVTTIIQNKMGIKAIETDMCINSCLMYTGPLSTLQKCPHCNKPCYELFASQKCVTCQWFSTIPLGPQLQALEGAHHMHYHTKKTQEILDQLECSDVSRCTRMCIMAKTTWQLLHEVISARITLSSCFQSMGLSSTMIRPWTAGFSYRLTSIISPKE